MVTDAKERIAINLFCSHECSNPLSLGPHKDLNRHQRIR